jgi:hypothetical protein
MTDILATLGWIWLGAVLGFIVAALCCASGKADQ